MRQNVSTVSSSATAGFRTRRTIHLYTSLWRWRNNASNASRSPVANRSSVSMPCYGVSNPARRPAAVLIIFVAELITETRLLIKDHDQMEQQQPSRYKQHNGRRLLNEAKAQ